MHAVHELHIWRLNQQKSLASAHIVVSEKELVEFVRIANTINECLHAYGIHSATLQPEISPNEARHDEPEVSDGSNGTGVAITSTSCQIGCQGRQCGDASCCD